MKTLIKFLLVASVLLTLNGCWGDVGDEYITVSPASGGASRDIRLKDIDDSLAWLEDNKTLYFLSGRPGTRQTVYVIDNKKSIKLTAKYLAGKMVSLTSKGSRSEDKFKIKDILKHLEISKMDGGGYFYWVSISKNISGYLIGLDKRVVEAYLKSTGKWDSYYTD